MFLGDSKMLSVCWFSLLSMLQPEFENDVIVPIMDGINKNMIQKFSSLIKTLDVARAGGLSEENVSIRNSQNIFGEVFYAGSRFSVFTQVVDVISYLRQVADWAREGLVLKDFKKALLPIARKLEPAMTREEIILMNGERVIRDSKN